MIDDKLLIGDLAADQATAALRLDHRVELVLGEVVLPAEPVGAAGRRARHLGSGAAGAFVAAPVSGTDAEPSAGAVGPAGDCSRFGKSEARSVGKEGVSTCKYRG